MLSLLPPPRISDLTWTCWAGPVLRAARARIVAGRTATTVDGRPACSGLVTRAARASQAARAGPAAAPAAVL
eukprot:10453427-Alexandrium_andersonii.AAC.1